VLGYFREIEDEVLPSPPMFTSMSQPPVVPVHYTTVFKHGAPVLCLSSELSKSATDDARYVSCEACLALMSVAQREERAVQVRRHR
jgi:hypothetical protein